MAWKFQLINKPYVGVTEGPVWDGEAIYFTHIPASRIMRYDPRFALAGIRPTYLGRLRDKCLSEDWFWTPFHARAIVKA